LARCDQFGILDSRAGGDETAALGLGRLTLRACALLGTHACLFDFGLAALLGFTLIGGVAHGSADDCAGGGSDGGARACFTGLVADDGAKNGATNGADGSARAGVLAGILAAGQSDEGRGRADG
jgi:hypothetical protein